VAVIKLVLILVVFASPSVALAVETATIPSSDRRGTRDHPALKRYEGSLIVAYDQKAFTEFTLPLSRLEEVPGKKDHRNVRAYEPKQKKVLEGAYMRLVYLVPANRSPLEVLRNYQEEVRGKGGKTLYECKDAECGGKPQGGSEGWAGHMTLARFLYPADRVTDPFGSTGWCAVTQRVADLRYAVAELADGAGHASVLTYVLKSTASSCKALNDRTIVIVDIVEPKEREQRMVTVPATEMAKAIAGSGRIALYGIYFDFNKSDLKPDSDPTLEQIGTLLRGTPALKLLVVGHTDNVGDFTFNMELSQRRAAAVVAALTARYGVGKERLTPVGVSFASPVASNKSEEGRAKNRRVELVEN
jgi:outer membrane protein OmpA-like peptidoglycan-associated protein